MTMNEAWIERQTATPEARRLYEQERLVLWATSALSEVMEESNVSKAELARRMGTSRANVTLLLAGGRNMTLRTFAEVAFRLGRRVDVKLEPLREGRFMSSPVGVVRQFRPRVVVNEPHVMPEQTKLFDESPLVREHEVADSSNETLAA